MRPVDAQGAHGREGAPMAEWWSSGAVSTNTSHAAFFERRPHSVIYRPRPPPPAVGLFCFQNNFHGAFLRARQRETSPMMWSALYQQRPAPEEGDYFKATWLKPCDKLPARETMRIYGGSDYAVTADGGDYTVHLVVGIDPEGRMYLLDRWRKQSSSDEWIEAFCDLVLEWKPVGWAEENGQISAGVGPALDKRQRERKAYCYRQQFPTRGDKAVRAQSIRGRMALEGLYVPSTAPWFAEFKRELLSFPVGKHDDQVDALGLIGQLLDQMVPGQSPKRPESPKRDTGYRPIALGERLGDWLCY
jgi:predicted phage terminase large subunit-like protein